MRRIFVMALMAATAIVPAVASAQDRGHWGDRGDGNGGGSAQQRADRPQRPAWNGNGNGGGQRPAWNGDGGRAQRPDWSGGQPRNPQQNQPAPQVQAEGQVRGGWRARSGGGFSGGADARAGGGWRGQRGDAGVSVDGERSGPEGGVIDKRAYPIGQVPGFRGPRPPGQAGQWGGNPPPAGDRGRPGGYPRQPDGYRDGRGQGSDGWRGNPGGYGGGNYAWRDPRGDRGGRWNRDWRGDTRYNWQNYRSSNRNAYRLPRYYAPYGWNYGYRRFSIGVTLSSALFAQGYWIGDPYNYRLPEVYGPYRWVRYYNDALLVDIYSGQVVDVVYDIFW